MDLIEHIEKYLGTITGGESVIIEEYGKIILLQFENQPFEDIITHMTLGFSNHNLHINEQKEVRMEVIISVCKEQNNITLDDLLIHISNKMLINHKAILRGQVIPIPSTISLGSFSSLYVSIPVFHDDDFASLKDVEPNIVFAWLFPIYENEAEFIQREGWNRFEDFLQENDIDNFWDLTRNEFRL